MACCTAAQNFQFDLQNKTVEHNLLIMTTAILDFGEETNVIGKWQEYPYEKLLVTDVVPSTVEM